MTAAETSTAVYVPMTSAIGIFQFGAGFLVLDRLHSLQVRQLLALSYGGLAVAIFIQNTIVSNATSAGLFSFLFGACVGTKEAILIIIFATTFGTTALGKIQGLATGVGMLSTGVGPLAFSACRDLTGGCKSRTKREQTLTATNSKLTEASFARASRCAPSRARWADSAVTTFVMTAVAAAAVALFLSSSTRDTERLYLSAADGVHDEL